MKTMRALRSRWAGRAGAAALVPVMAAAAYAQRPEAAPPVRLLGKEVPAPRRAITDHVVVISIDGLRPDAIGEYGAETIQRLMMRGRFTLEAQTIVPSKTLPSHTSMLTGAGPEAHGVLWNSEEMDEHGTVATPTIFALARRAGLETAAFFSKSKFQHLMAPGTLDYGQAPDGWPGKWLAGRTAGDVEKYLESEKPNLLFVHFGEPDFVGHALGWMTAPYGWAVRQADQGVARVLAAADRAFGEGNYTVILTADHGGHGRNHGSADPRDVTIPWIAWGKGVRPGKILPSDVRTMDTAATALWLLGLEAPPAPGIGVAVTEAFTRQPVLARTPAPAGSAEPAGPLAP